MIHAIPVFRRTDAVYFDDDENRGNKLIRTPVVAILWESKDEYMSEKEKREIDGYPHFVDSCSTDGYIDDPANAGNFLGYEFDGVQQYWEEYIRAYLIRKERKKEKKK